MAPVVPAKHKAVATVALRAPLALIEVDTKAPGPGEVVVQVQWDAQTPLNLHRADGGLLITQPFVLGSSFAGTVVQVGPPSPDPEGALLSPASRDLAVADAVFGFTWAKQEHRSMQEYVTVPSYLLGRIPAGVSPEAASTVPDSLVTALNTVTRDLGLELPWPVPAGGRALGDAPPVLVWGAASSVGTFVVQVLRHWGYRNVLAVASGRNHAYLRGLGARAAFEYNDADVVDQILRHVSSGRSSGDGPRIPFVVDCIGSVEGTLTPLSKIAEKGTRVAVMLPVIVRHASEDEAPVYEMDVEKVLVGAWAEGVQLRGVRTHFYLDNEFFKYYLQPEIMPALLEQGVIQPNRTRVVEGKTLLERANNALSFLRARATSGERLVVRIADEQKVGY